MKKHRTPGRGLLLRVGGKLLPQLRRWPLPMPGLPEARIDLSQASALTLFDYSLGDFGPNRHLIGFMERFLRSGDSLWDVGGNVGVITCHFANPKFGLAGIETFEPFEQASRILRGLTTGQDRISVNAFALGDKPGRFPFFAQAKRTSMGSLVKSDAGGDTVEVEVRCGDDYLKESRFPAPRVIKIDVEGFEAPVMRGMQSMILSRRPVVVFEHLFMSEDDLLSLLPPESELVFIADDGKIFRDAAQRNLGADGAYVPKELLGNLRVSI